MRIRCLICRRGGAAHRLHAQARYERTAQGIHHAFCGESLGRQVHRPAAGLIAALRKRERVFTRMPLEAASPATAHMFILNPFSGTGLFKLFSTHPSTEERIARLEKMREEPSAYYVA